MHIKHKLLTVTLLVSMMSACSGSGGSNVRSSSSDPNTFDDPDNKTSRTLVEETAQDSSDVTGEVGKTIQVLGATISQAELPMVGTVTDGAGNVVSELGEGVGVLSTGIHDGLGDISNNDNAVGTTVSGATGLVSQVGEAVSETGNTVEALNTLPVLAQLDEASGVLTTVGGTVDSLGLKVTDLGDYLTLAFVGEDGAATELTTELTAVVRPLIINVDGAVKTVGQAIVITPVVSGLIGQVGSAVVVLGESIEQQDNIVLASAGGVVKGAGVLLVQLDGNLTMAPEESSGLDGLQTLEVAQLLNEAPSGNLISQLLGNELSLGDTDLLATLLNQDNNVLTGLTDTLDGLTGGLLAERGDLVGQLTGSLGNPSGDLLGTQVLSLTETTTVLNETTTLLTGTLGGVTSGLTGAGDSDLVGGVLDTVGDVSGGLLDTQPENGNNSSNLLNGLLGGLVNR